MAKKMYWWGAHAETKGGGSWWLKTRASTRRDAERNIRNQIKKQSDAKILTVYVERMRRK